MASNRRRTPERNELINKVIKMLSRGMSKHAISLEINDSPANTRAVLKAAVDAVLEERIVAHDELVAVKLAEYREIKNEAWAAWERSKLDHVKYIKEVYKGKKKKNEDGDDVEVPPVIKKIKSREGKLPNSSYLTIIMDCIQAERELLGIDAALKISVNNKHSIDWDDFSKVARVAASQNKFDQVEDELMLMIDDPSRNANPPIPDGVARVMDPEANGHGTINKDTTDEEDNREDNGDDQ